MPSEGFAPSSLVGSSSRWRRRCRGKEVVAGPRKRIHVLEVGEVLAIAPVERFEDADEVNEEGLAARAGEEGVGTGLDDVRFRSEGQLGVADDRRPDGLGLTSLRPGCLAIACMQAAAPSSAGAIFRATRCNIA